MMTWAVGALGTTRKTSCTPEPGPGGGRTSVRKGDSAQGLHAKDRRKGAQWDEDELMGTAWGAWLLQNLGEAHMETRERQEVICV